jgi:hypothetical protein
MKHRVPIFLVVVVLISSMVACVVPDEWIDALSRLPTPTPTIAPPSTGTQYVYKTGNDSNDCATPDTACLTVNMATYKAPPGALILIGPGIYPEVDFTRVDPVLHTTSECLDCGVVIDKDLTLRGEGSSGSPTAVLSGSAGRIAVAVRKPVQVVLENVEISGGSGGLGWGLDTGSSGSNVTLRNSVVRDNTMTGVHVRNSTVILENVLITGNAGGGIYNYQGNVTVRTSRIVDNHGSQPAVHNTMGGTMVINSSTIAGNEVTDGGSVLNDSGANMGINGSTISGNGSAAAVNNQMGSTLTLTNSTISGNAGMGVVTLGNLTLMHATIAENGDTGLYANATINLRMHNSLIENNGAQDCTFQLNASITLTLEGLNLSDGSCLSIYGGHQERPPEGDAFLGPLADNGGPTLTHALLEGSPAIDAATGFCPDTDQRGYTRPAGSACDVGAYESNASPPLFPAPIAITPGVIGPTSTPTAPATPAPASKPQVGLTENANCRKGPGTAYKIVTSIEKGQTANVEGRNQEGSWWLIQVPDSDAHCWISDVAVDKPAPLDGLEVVVPPPLPDPPGQFGVTNRVCNQGAYAVTLSWTTASGATGYNLYRGGKLLATLNAKTTKYVDHPTRGHAYNYELETVNENGVSIRLLEQEEACP